jgi:hypothetical protein
MKLLGTRAARRGGSRSAMHVFDYYSLGQPEIL